MALLRDGMEQMESESAWKLWSQAAIVHPPSLRRRDIMAFPGQQPPIFFPRTSNNAMTLYNNSHNASSIIGEVQSISNAKRVTDIVARNERVFGNTTRGSSSPACLYSNHHARGFGDCGGPVLSVPSPQKIDVWKEALRKQGLLTIELEETILKDSRQETTNKRDSHNHSAVVEEEARQLGATDEWLEDVAKLMVLKDKIKRLYGQEGEEESQKNTGTRTNDTEILELSSIAEDGGEEPVMETIQRTYRPPLERDPEKEWQEIQNMLLVANNMPTLAGGDDVNEDKKQQAAGNDTNESHNEQGGLETATGRSTPVKYTSVNDGTDPQIMHDNDIDNDSTSKSVNSVCDAEKRQAEARPRRAATATAKHDSYIMKMIKKHLSLDNQDDHLWLHSRDSFEDHQAHGEQTVTEKLIRMMKNMDACLFDSRFCHECGSGGPDDSYYCDDPHHSQTPTSSSEKPKEMYSFLERITSRSDAMVVATLMRGQPSNGSGDSDGARAGDDYDDDDDDNEAHEERGDGTTSTTVKSRRVHFQKKKSITYSSDSSATSVSSSSAISAASSVSSQYQTEIVLEGHGCSKYSDNSRHVNYNDRNDSFHNNNDTDASIVSYYFEGDDNNNSNGHPAADDTRRRNNSKQSSNKTKKHRTSDNNKAKKRTKPLEAIQQSLRFRRRAERR